MTLAKFDTHDKVIPNKRTPRSILELIRPNRKRTIVLIFYDPDRQCRYHYLGTNNRGKFDGFVSSYPFRSYMLDKPLNRGAGRPRTKRNYRKSEGGKVKPLGPAPGGLISQLRG